MVLTIPPFFPHRRNRDGSFDSICLKCLVTIANEESIKRSNCLLAGESKTKESQTVVAVWLLLKCYSVSLAGAVAAFATGVEELADGADKAAGVGRRADSAGEDGLIGDIPAAVVGACVFMVLVDDVSCEVDASEDALAA